MTFLIYHVQTRVASLDSSEDDVCEPLVRETMFDEKTIDGSIAHIQIEVICDVTGCDDLDSLDMFDNL